MARFARIDSQIRANRMILANYVRVPELNPFFGESRLRGPKIANRRLETIRANRLHVMEIRVFLRGCPSTVLCTVPSCESVNFRWIPS